MAKHESDWKPCTLEFLWSVQWVVLDFLKERETISLLGHLGGVGYHQPSPENFRILDGPSPLIKYRQTVCRAHVSMLEKCILSIPPPPQKKNNLPQNYPPREVIFELSWIKNGVHCSKRKIVRLQWLEKCIKCQITLGSKQLKDYFGWGLFLWDRE